MTLQEIRAFYNYFITTADEVGLVLHIVLEENGETVIRQADIDDVSRLDLKKMYLDSLAHTLLDEDLEYLPISQGDARSNTMYSYDLPDIPVGLGTLAEVLRQDEYPIFNFQKDNFESIRAFIITIGNANHKMALYKAHSHLNLIRGASIFGLRYANERFERVRENIIKLSKQIDFFMIGNQLFILNLKLLERGFNFSTIIRQKAEQNINIIEGLNLLEDTAPLVEMINELKYAKRMMGIKSDSPVLQIPVPAIIEFVKSYPPIMRKFRISENGEKLFRYLCV